MEEQAKSQAAAAVAVAVVVEVAQLLMLPFLKIAVSIRMSKTLRILGLLSSTLLGADIERNLLLSINLQLQLY